MAWKITHDLLAEQGEPNHVGRGQDHEALKGAETVTFRLLDDDLEHYYTGVCTLDAYRADGEGSLTEAWEWGMADSGTTECCVRLEDAVEKFGMNAEIAQRIVWKTGRYKGWITLFA